MLRTSSLWKLLSFCLLAQVGLAHAQQTPPKSTPPSAAPPKLERLEEGSERPATELPKKNDPQITEKRDGGQVKEVKVKTGKSSYVMKGRSPAARANDQNGGTLGAPQWQVLEFDMNKKKKAASGEASDASAPVPPPAAK